MSFVIWFIVLTGVVPMLIFVIWGLYGFFSQYGEWRAARKHLREITPYRPWKF